mmetsp:Transcript_20144/g.14864  ORF Transcript_20144/g.14864 Transcript_20144/m.14864 type:complete len:171 (+) Transcript_20144:460-972(+)
MIKKIKDIMEGSKATAENMFDMYCQDKKSNKMQIPDFKAFVRFYHEKVEEHELDTFLRHFDPIGKGFITKDDFVQAFGRAVREQVFQISIEDIIKPLQTKIKKFNVNVPTLFDKYDANRNGKISTDEIVKAIQKDMKIKLEDDEVVVIKEFIKNKFRSNEIRRTEFVELF